MRNYRIRRQQVLFARLHTDHNIYKCDLKNTYWNKMIFFAEGTLTEIPLRLEDRDLVMRDLDLMGINKRALLNDRDAASHDAMEKVFNNI
jgi:hypothetical protein